MSMDTERFWSKIDKNGPISEFNPALGPCWVWVTKEVDGYVYFYPKGEKAVSIHKYAYTLVKGEIPEGYHVDHLCMVRRCANPDHLEVVTPKVNNQREAAAQPTRTHCKRGHELSEENCLPGKRACGICRDQQYEDHDKEIDPRVAAYEASKEVVEAWRNYFRNRYAYEKKQITRAQLNGEWDKLWAAHITSKNRMRWVREWKSW